jgi:hypothetical protein
MSTRAQNEKKFGQWAETRGGGRRYWIDVAGRQGWRARCLKEVDANEATLRFWQEIYDSQGRLSERAALPLPPALEQREVQRRART